MFRFWRSLFRVDVGGLELRATGGIKTPRSPGKVLPFYPTSATENTSIRQKSRPISISAQTLLSQCPRNVQPPPQESRIFSPPPISVQHLNHPTPVSPAEISPVQSPFRGLTMPTAISTGSTARQRATVLHPRDAPAAEVTPPPPLLVVPNPADVPVTANAKTRRRS